MCEMHLKIYHPIAAIVYVRERALTGVEPRCDRSRMNRQAPPRVYIIVNYALINRYVGQRRRQAVGCNYARKLTQRTNVIVMQLPRLSFAAARTVVAE
jgi:hypothetical protein